MKASASPAPATEDSKYVAKWAKFISKNPLNQPKTWQYWRDDVRPKNQFNKKIISRFSKGVKSQQKAKTMIRSGIPDDHRGEVWWACCGGAELMEASKSSYADYLQLAADTPDNPAADTILKDLHRTFIYKEMTERISLSDGSSSSSPGMSSEEERERDAIVPLKNILLAYSLRNPEVGYCQSMNFLCAMLLLHLEEEQAFWVLAALVETLLLHDYYAPSMRGSRVDQLTFQSCLAWKLPRLFSHLRALDVILEPILCPWFLCMFLHVLPLDAVQRIWDVFFFEGNVILFRIGLAICKLLEAELLASDDIGTLFMLLKKPFEGHECPDELVETLLTAAFDKSWLGSIPRADLDHFRSLHLETLREVDREEEAARTLFACESAAGGGGDSAKKKSVAQYSGVERSLANVLQSSESFRGKIEARSHGSSEQSDSQEDVSVPLRNLSTDEKDEDDAPPPPVSTIAFRPPSNRRTSLAMKTLLTQQN